MDVVERITVGPVVFCVVYLEAAVRWHTERMVRRSEWEIVDSIKRDYILCRLDGTQICSKHTG